MTDINSKDFQKKIYLDLDEKLRASSWKSGASEAHGLLTGLASRGITSLEIQNKMHMFQLSPEDDSTLLEGLFELILRDLESTNPTFNLLLPEDDESLVSRADELANWTGGYIQGFCYDGESSISTASQDVQELIQDIMDISGMQMPIGSLEENSEDDERSLMEIEEYLKLGVQLIFDENSADRPRVENPNIDQIH
jgi:uncharacterized protein YgfB (UPF0149 family)